MNRKQLIQQFHEVYPQFSKSAIEKIISIGDLKSINKKEHYIQKDKLDRSIAFVIEGLFRGYILHEDEEATLWFSAEHEILASYSGILLNEKSRITYEALEPSTIFIIQYDELKALARKEVEVAFSLIELLEGKLLEAMLRNERFVLMDAEARYINLLANKSNIVQRVSQKLLASYIGITPVSLSRLRSRLQNKKQ